MTLCRELRQALENRASAIPHPALREPWEQGRAAVASWTPILEAVRLGPADDATAVTAAQLRDIVHRLIALHRLSG